VVDRFNHIDGSYRKYLKGYLDKLVKFLDRVDITTLSVFDEKASRLVEIIQDKKSEMITNKKRYFSFEMGFKNGNLKIYKVNAIK